MKLKLIISTIISIFILNCASWFKKEPTEKKVEYQILLPEKIRLEKFPETWNIKGKGKVTVPCGDNCTESIVEKYTQAEIKAMLKEGDWEEYVQKDKMGDGGEKYSVLTAKGPYKNGQREGLWQDFYETGEVLREVSYSKGVKNGIEKKYHSTGVQTEETNFVNGIKQGKHWQKSKSNKPLREGQYLDDKKDGLWTEYYLEQEGVVKNKALYSNDKKNGKYQGFYPTSQKSREGEFLNDLENGPWKFYYQKGALQQEGSFEPKPSPNPDDPTLEKPKSKKVGLWKIYYQSGSVFSEGQRDGRPTGDWKFYFKTGKLRVRGSMANDLMISNAKIYNEDGSLWGEGKMQISFVLIDEKTDELKDKIVPSFPFIFYKNGYKEMELTNQESNGKVLTYTYNSSGKKIGEGYVHPLVLRKDGCWTENEKKTFYLMGTVKTGVIAKMNNCE